MRSIVKEDNIRGETAPFSFHLSSGGEELKAAPHVFMPSITQKIVELLHGRKLQV